MGTSGLIYITCSGTQQEDISFPDKYTNILTIFCVHCLLLFGVDVYVEEMQEKENFQFSEFNQTSPQGPRVLSQLQMVQPILTLQLQSAQ